MKQFTAIIILLTTLNCFGQYQFDRAKISKQTQRVVEKIEKVNELMGSAVSFAGFRPPQYDNFTELRDKATQEELVELTNHPNGVVRCYAFWGLSYYPSANLLPIVIKHIDDTASVNTLFGCIISKEKVGDFFINVVTPEIIDSNSKTLTVIQRGYLDSILLFTPNKLYARENAISRIKVNETFYERVRELVLKENNQSALVTLAKFKKKRDIPLILNSRLKGEKHNKLFFTYKAISEFPNEAFLPLLRKSLYEAIEKDGWSTEWRELYRAIASFKNDTALSFLKVPFNQTKHRNIRQYHINSIFGAVQESYTPIYNELLWEMWENDKKINTKVFDLLYAKNPGKGLELTKKTIQNAGDFYYLSSYNVTEDSPINLLDVMLDTILVRDKSYAIDLINKNIREINVHQFPTFADKAAKIKDTSLVTSLFDRLEKEDNPHIYLKATEVLIAFKDKEINKRIVKVSKSNLNLQKDWGGREFLKLLQGNSIE